MSISGCVRGAELLGEHLSPALVELQLHVGPSYSMLLSVRHLPPRTLHGRVTWARVWPPSHHNRAGCNEESPAAIAAGLSFPLSRSLLASLAENPATERR